MNLKKTVLITGASRGIGAECARLFAKNGFNVVINYNKSEECANALYDEISRFNENVLLCRCDVSDEGCVRSMFEQIDLRFGGVDILVNNAAVSSFGLLQETEKSEWEKVFGVNMTGTYLCSKAALPYMINKKDGCIINISSMWGLCGASMEVCYSASKAAIIGFTKALAKELAPSGIRVNCIAPGCVETDMNSHLGKDEKSALCEEIPLGRFANACEIASAVFDVYNSSYMTGQVISINGGMVI